MKCENCGNEENGRFCSNCGKELLFEPKEQEVFSAEVCDDIPTQTHEKVTKECNNENIVNDEKASASNNHKCLKKILALFIVFAIVLSVFIGIINKLNKETSAIEGITYLKNGDIFFSDLKEDSITQLTSSLVDYDWGYDWDRENDYSGYSREFSTVIKYSEDGRYVIYPNRENTEANLSLYCRDLKTDEVYFIDRGVSSYYDFASDGAIYYIREDDTLYKFEKEKADGEQRTRVQTDVWSMTLSKDKTKMFLNGFEEPYVYDIERGLQSIFYGVTENGCPTILAMSRDLNTMIFEHDDVIYYYSYDTNTLTEFFEQKDEYSEILDVLLNEDGSVYFSFRYIEPTQYSVFFKDSLKDSDTKITEPDIEEYKYKELQESSYSWSDYTWYETKIKDEYFELSEKYTHKENRDDVREILNSNSVGLSKYDLYYYQPDYEEPKTILSSRLSLSLRSSSAETGTVVFAAGQELQSGYLDLKDYEYYGESRIAEICNKITSEISKEERLYVSNSGLIVELAHNFEQPVDFCLDSVDKIEFIEYSSEKQSYERKTVDFDGALVEPDTLETSIEYKFESAADVIRKTYSDMEYNENGYFWESEYDSTLYYDTVKTEDMTYSVWVIENEQDTHNNKLIIENIDTGEYIHSEADVDTINAIRSCQNTVCYMSETRDGDFKIGKLNYLDISKSIKTVLAEDVFSYQIIGDNKVIYLAEYNLDTNKGNLYYFDGNKSIFIDSEVTAIIPRYLNQNKSFDNFYGLSNSDTRYGMHSCMTWVSGQFINDYAPFGIFGIDKEVREEDSGSNYDSN